MSFIKSLFATIKEIVVENRSLFILIAVASVILGIIIAFFIKKPMKPFVKKTIKDELNNSEIYKHALLEFNPPEPEFIYKKKQELVQPIISSTNSEQSNPETNNKQTIPPKDPVNKDKNIENENKDNNVKDKENNPLEIKNSNNSLDSKDKQTQKDELLTKNQNTKVQKTFFNTEG